MMGSQQSKASLKESLAAFTAEQKALMNSSFVKGEECRGGGMA